LGAPGGHGRFLAEILLGQSPDDRPQCRPGAGSREQRELMIAANNGYLLAFDNLSGLSHCLPDALCRPATGGSFG
jgi:hypothetical protein